MADAEHYKRAYGEWAGNPKGNVPVFTRCCANLHDRYHPGGYQCTRKRGYGPDGAYCKLHDPDAVKVRREKADQEHRRKHYADMKRAYGSSFLEVLRKIAAGHNDPRSLAAETVDNFDAAFKPKESA